MTVLIAALLGSLALADGGAARTPLGVPQQDTVTLTCQSGRRLLFFSPNTQFVNLLYRGKVWHLAFLSAPAAEGEYSDVGLPGMADFDLPRFGTGLEWRSTVRTGPMWNASELFRVVQQPDGRRRLTLIERCQG